MGKFKINGVDVLATYNMQVSDFRESATPLNSIRINNSSDQEVQRKKITIDFNLVATDHSTVTLRSRIEAVGELIGYYGTRQKEVLIEQLYSENTAVAYSYIVVVEEFKVNQEKPVFDQHGITGSMTFAVIAAIDPSGKTVRSISLTGVASFSRNYYFEDTNAKQGSSLPLIKYSTSSASSPFSIQALAIDDKFSYVLGYSKNGSIIMADGQFGNLAIDVEASGAYLSYPSIATLGLSGTNQATIVIKFKRNFAGSDATDKYLFGESGAPLSLRIAANTQNIILAFPGGGTTTLSPGSTALSNTQWNTIIVVLDPSIAGGARLELYVNGVFVVSGGATIGSVGSTSGTLYIGNSTAGTNPCKCTISEFAIYKYPIAPENLATHCPVIGSLNRPIAEAAFLDLNRNLTFLLDMSNEFRARSNRSGYIALQNLVTSSDMIVLDCPRVTAKKFVKTTGSSTDISNEIDTPPGYIRDILFQRYNKLAVTVPSSGSASMTASYEGYRYR